MEYALRNIISYIKLFSSAAGWYIARGWCLLWLRRFGSSFAQVSKRPAHTLSGALMMLSTSTIAPPINPALPLATPPAVAVSAPAAVTVIPIRDGTGRPAPNLQGIPEAIPQPPGSRFNRYARGNCTWYVAFKRAVPANWGNARTWLPRAKAAGHATGAIPVPGAIAWTPNGRYGHVAYVEQVDGGRVLVSEMNYRGFNVTSQRWVSSTEFNYIY